MNKYKFSVSMCVYGKDNAEHFREALSSVYNQTRRPDEVVLVVDGPVPDGIDKVIEEFQRNEGMCVYRLPENMGHGVARREGFSHCQYDYIAIADADDINAENRFELQMAALEGDSEISAISSAVTHFIGSADNIINAEYVPLEDSDIKKAMKTGCPINQPAVILKKSDVEKAGGYLDWYHAEDYYLWIRMMLCGAKFKNLGECLVNMRTSREQMLRRGGRRYFKSIKRLYRLMLKKKIISVPTYLYNVLGRFAVQVLMPPKMRLAVRKIIQQRDRR